MALVAFHIHVDNLIADAVNIVTLGLFLIPQRYFIATIEVYIFIFPAPRQPPRYQQQSLTYPRGQVGFVHPGRWTILNWITWMSMISSRCIRNNSLSSTSAFCLFLDKFIRLKATSILSLKRRIKKWLTRLCLCGSACSFCSFIRWLH